MASVRESFQSLTTYLPFVKTNNDGNTSGISSWILAHCTIWHLLYMTGLVAAFVAGGVLGHLYWRRVRAWTRRSHARAHRWMSARRGEIVAQWDGVVARLEGAVAGWNNKGTDKGQQPVITITTTANEARETPSSPAQQGGGGGGSGGGGKKKRRYHVPGMGR
ncbi:hypothetical protein PG984_015295 [Apiospora sp. TS-2023a]